LQGVEQNKARVSDPPLDLHSGGGSFSVHIPRIIPADNPAELRKQFQMRVTQVQIQGA
jgi:hypothetical protein